MDDEQVRPIHSLSLPPSDQDQWTHGVKSPINVETKFLSEEMILKLQKPKLSRHKELIIKPLPKKKGPPSLNDEWGTQGWGIYASMGFSFWKFFWWLTIGEFISVVFCIVWIWFRGDAQLTAAVVPGTFFMSVLALLNGMSQRLEKPWKPISEASSPDTSQRMGPDSQTGQLSQGEGGSSAVEVDAETLHRRQVAPETQTGHEAWK